MFFCDFLAKQWTKHWPLLTTWKLWNKQQSNREHQIAQSWLILSHITKWTERMRFGHLLQEGKRPTFLAHDSVIHVRSAFCCARSTNKHIWALAPNSRLWIHASAYSSWKYGSNEVLQWGLSSHMYVWVRARMRVALVHACGWGVSRKLQLQISKWFLFSEPRSDIIFVLSAEVPRQQSKEQ